MRHVAMIPARAGSVGLPGKNRMFFDDTADFVDAEGWFDRVIVSTDDPIVMEMARERGYEADERPKDLAGPDVSIKAVFEHVIPAMEVGPDDVLWLFYLPVLLKDPIHFHAARGMIEKPEVRSLCSFTEAPVHPYHIWRVDPETGRISQYVENDVYRRQDMPPAWRHYHYTCCFEAAELPNLNSELLNEGTTPIFLDAATTARLIEVDTPEDLERWKRKGGRVRRNKDRAR